MSKLYFSEESERFARSAWEALKLEPPVDLKRVADKLGIEIYYEPFVDEIDGFYLLMPSGSPIVAVNNCHSKTPGRQRFTAAHEIGHHLLRSRISPTQSRLFFVDGANVRKTLMERACDKFAALLLMPDELVLKWFSELSANPEHRVGIMADRFGVSISAMRMRLRELHLPYQVFRYRRR